eukprot:3659520-Rhodomonas_salina.1
MPVAIRFRYAMPRPDMAGFAAGWWVLNGGRGGPGGERGARGQGRPAAEGARGRARGGRARRARLGPVQTRPRLLRRRYALSGTDADYAATRLVREAMGELAGRVEGLLEAARAEGAGADVLVRAPTRLRPRYALPCTAIPHLACAVRCAVLR